MDIVESSIAAVAAVFSGWAAYSAMQAARAADRNSQAANRTAELAYQTAEAVAQIERDRWHRELTPNITFRVTRERGHVELLVRYGGPPTLGRLTALDLRIRDDRDRSNDSLLGGGLTADERDSTVWGPWRFRHSANGADGIGRSVESLSLMPGEEYRLGLDPTHPHRLYGGGLTQWEKDYREKDVRLWVDCHVEGHKPWNLTADLPQRLGDSLGVRWASAQ
ncbi:hypothetical protein OG765_37635 [Streptomyces sp. NBC_00555]|uniref:hypothetical protein n=1 Tax=Streptomyces sp. NBC_00555 TaxID=2903662 RepID=UPI0022539F81|nr:hypothetical protein [Streptomyces sp. NBC_00555]MCX5016647.1 hypothetical protein [Streptomyces sp. NBC_00555]